MYEGAEKERLVKLYSTRNALYRAFDTDYGRVGHSRGVDGAVAYLKAELSDDEEREGRASPLAFGLSRGDHGVG